MQGGKEDIHGLVDLPDELLLEIISHFEAPRPPSARRPLGFPTRAHFERRKALIALSFTCRNLRRVFRPYVWERVEVLSGMKVRERILQRDEYRITEKKPFYNELIRQLNVVTTLPALAKSVRIVDVELTDFNLVTSLFRLGRAFSLFPNLHTVMIAQHVGRGRYMSPADQTGAQYAFRKCCYPQIQSVILSAVAYPLLEVCPNLRSFEACVGFSFDYFFKFLKHTIHMQRFSSGRRISLLRAFDVANAIPTLQEISVYIHGYEFAPPAMNRTITQITTLIRLLKNLQVLTIESNIHCIQIKEIILKISSRDLTGLKQVVIRSTLYGSLFRHPVSSVEILNLPLSTP